MAEADGERRARAVFNSKSDIATGPGYARAPHERLCVRNIMLK